eukprot:7327185-Prymnesium_polylepis.1
MQTLQSERRGKYVDGRLPHARSMSMLSRSLPFRFCSRTGYCRICIEISWEASKFGCFGNL